MKKGIGFGVENADLIVDRAYDLIRDGIINLEFKPGVFLTENMLAERFDLNRTPIREALKRLEEHSYIQIVPRKGALVVDLSAEKIVEIYQLREALECFAIRFVPQYGDREELKRLGEQAKKLEEWIENNKLDKINSFDNSLHSFIVKSTGNKQIMKIVDQLLKQITRLRNMTPLVPGRLSQQAKEQREIIAALEVDNVDEAADFLRNHLKNVMDNSIKIRMNLL